MIDDAVLAGIAARLEADRERLEAAIADLSHRESLSEASGENAYRDHMADQGSATFERDLEMTFEENEREALEEVVAALNRLEAGTYGICSRCGAEIPRARLEAMPTATLCVTCKAADETR
jgi:RNA polymerase-binding transcription factor